MLTYFESRGHFVQALHLPYDLEGRLDDWAALRLRMVGRPPSTFTRDEWAFLIGFLDRSALQSVFTQAFGPQVDAPGERRVDALWRPRSRISVWLPNNVSLLGPLLLILVSMSGATVSLKAGSRADDLCQAFLDYARAALSDRPLGHYLATHVQVQRFDRDSPQNRTLAQADVRIVFGSDAAVAAIGALPHPPGSVLIPFADHQSEAWAEPEALTEAALAQIIKVFSIYGTGGCTSPRRLRLIDATEADCLHLQARLMALWPSVVRQDVPMHQASQNVAWRQVLAAQGWQATLAPRHAAVLAVGAAHQQEGASGLGSMTLAIVPSRRDALTIALPANVQTIGHVVRDPQDPRWLALLAGTPIKRFVPVAAMHDFSPIWDGSNFWRSLFEQVDIRP